MEELYALSIIIVMSFVFAKAWKYFIFPAVLNKTTTIVEKNPKWITPKLREKYYGFSNIDIITARSTIGILPRFRLVKKKDKIERLELLIAEDTSVNDIDKVAQVALCGKLHILYGLPIIYDKPAHWLAILLYMLDGGDIKEEATSWENKNK